MPSYRSYIPAPYGIGSQFPETERLPTYASKLINRFINPGGGAEKRRGLTQIGPTITSVSAPNLNSHFEYIYAQGTAQLIVAGASKTAGQSATRVWKLDTSAQTTWTQIYAAGDHSARMRFVQMDDKLIAVNGTDRNQHSHDLTSFKELQALVEQGVAALSAAGTAHDRLGDGDIKNWTLLTDVNINDLLFDTTTSAYAIITNVGSSQVTHTPLTAGSNGIASGNAAKNNGDSYEIMDLVELNIIDDRSENPNVGNLDNTGVLGGGSSATRTRVSSLFTGVSGFINFGTREARKNDWILNTTRNQPAKISKVSGTVLEHTTIVGQTSGDSVVFLKSAMPIADNVHVHYGRAYYIDSRDRRKLRISGPGDPQDMTTEAATLDATSFKIGDQSPVGDQINSLASFQQYLAVGGRRGVLLFSGTTPIQDTTAATTDFKPVAFFPQGVYSGNGLLTIGNDVIWIGPEGLESASLIGTITLPIQAHLSDAIRDEIQSAVSGADPDNVHLINYPKRQWVLVKVSSDLYVFNYAPNLGEQILYTSQVNPGQRKGSWSQFKGKIAHTNDIYLRADMSISMTDSSGRVYGFDRPGVFSDAGSAYGTTYQTAFLGLDEAKGVGQPTRRQKAGVALMTQIQGSANATYTISATAPYAGNESSDTITVVMSAADDPVQTKKLPLRWRGERVRLTYETATASNGPDVIGTQTIVFNPYGVR